MYFSIHRILTFPTKAAVMESEQMPFKISILTAATKTCGLKVAGAGHWGNPRTCLADTSGKGVKAGQVHSKWTSINMQKMCAANLVTGVKTWGCDRFQKR